MDRRSPDVLLFSDGEFDLVVSVGLYLGMLYLAPRSREGDHRSPRVWTSHLRAIIPTLPTKLLFCLHFASAILAESVIQQVDFSPLVAEESTTAIRTMTEFMVCSVGYQELCLILGNFTCHENDLESEETIAMVKYSFGFLVEAVIIFNARGDGVFDVGLKNAVELRLGRRTRGVLPHNVFNPYAKNIVKDLDQAVMEALKKEPLSHKDITQMLAEWQ